MSKLSRLIRVEWEAEYEELLCALEVAALGYAGALADGMDEGFLAAESMTLVETGLCLGRHMAGLEIFGLPRPVAPSRLAGLVEASEALWRVAARGVEPWGAVAVAAVQSLYAAARALSREGVTS